CGESQQASALQDSTQPQAQLAAGSSGFQQIYQMVQQVTRQDGAMENAIAQSGTNLIEVGNTAAKALTKQQPLTVAGRDGGDIGTQLSVVGELILAGLPTKAYQVSMGGFDTHSGELATQAELFSQLDAGVTALFNGLGRSARGAGAVLVLYTEFGRRVLANASGGTDHGSANVVFVIGREVRGGLYGEYPSLTRLDPNGNLIHTVDYRSVYATLIEHVLEMESRPFLGQSWPLLKFI
ncbi:MAG TPA: DUF1501 domain-containing protein, partial [Acidimicrobiales bacterium]|nr:DUF1501 domain-containing protein [Acidimicrobiales bacterium]